jgi:serine/threonine protein kinase
MDANADKILIKKLGRYEILSELGKGSMGIVYKAIDPLIDRTVAIKTINLNLSVDEIACFVERFNSEAKSAGRLNHPNIVTIYDVGRTDDVAFIAMEHLEGQELKEIITSKQKLPPARIVEITAQVADALAYAHDNGVVHRDIKPANIMVLRNGVVKIMDFGIAMTSSGSETQAGTILGSPKYMSPEQISGKAVDNRSDIFSLGAMLYELLTGISAFGGGSSSNITAIMYQVMNEIPDPPTKVNPSLPAAFDYIVSRALAKKPEERYQSAREMADDLRNFKKLKIPSRLPSPVLPRKRPFAYSQGNGDTTIFLDSNEKKSAFSGWSWQKKLIGMVIAAFIVVVAVLYIYDQSEPAKTAIADKESAIGSKALAPTTKKQSPTAAKSKAAGGQSKVRKNSKIAAPAKANLNLTILPWGEVFIDGKSMGVSPPLKNIKVSPGRHKIEIKNDAFSTYRKTVKLKAGESIKIRHKFK